MIRCARTRAAAGLVLAIICATAHGEVASASGVDPVQVNTGNTTMTASTPTLPINTSGGTVYLICAQANVPLRTAADGRGGVTANTATFVDCRLGGVRAVVTQPQPWAHSFKHLHSTPNGDVTSFTLDFTVPARGIYVVSGACSFELGGYPPGEVAFIRPPRPPHLQLTSLPSMIFPAPLASRLPLIVDNATPACALFGIADNQLADLWASFVFSPAVIAMALAD